MFVDCCCLFVVGIRVLCLCCLGGCHSLCVVCCVLFLVDCRLLFDVCCLLFGV